MPGPYFPGQEAHPCGCYHPDITFIRDESATNERVYHCTTHGEVRETLPQGTRLRKEKWGIPDDDWREGERKRLRGED